MQQSIYRAGEGVDLSGDGGKIHVYWIVAGEWIEYTFKVNEAGNYSYNHVGTVPGLVILLCLLTMKMLVVKNRLRVQAVL